MKNHEIKDFISFSSLEAKVLRSHEFAIFGWFSTAKWAQLKNERTFNGTSFWNFQLKSKDFNEREIPGKKSYRYLAEGPNKHELFLQALDAGPIHPWLAIALEPGQGREREQGRTASGD